MNRKPTPRSRVTLLDLQCAHRFRRYTYLDSAGYDAVIQRLQERIPEQKGISFEQFKAFCQFLNNLDDFAITMRMFTFANQPISQGESALFPNRKTATKLMWHIELGLAAVRITPPLLGREQRQRIKRAPLRLMSAG